LFLYFNTRKRMGTVDNPSGENVADTLGAARDDGFCPEALWPYDVERVSVAPPEACYEAAAQWHIRSRKVPQTAERIRALLANGTPVLFAFYVYESFLTDEVTKSGVTPMPRVGEERRGGHAALLVGYDDSTQTFVVRNSWGANWGQQGYCLVPYAYVLDPERAFDFYTIRTVRRVPPAPVSEDDALTRYKRYFADLGFEDRTPPDVDVVDETPGSTFGYYDPSQNRVVVLARVAEDLDVTLRQYSHHVLYAGGPMTDNSATDSPPGRAVQAIESGLANYFVCSFNDEPRFARRALAMSGGRESDWSLDNNRSFTELSTSRADPLGDGTIWGGAFWELRTRFGRAVTDRMLYRAWTALSAQQVEEFSGYAFIGQLANIQETPESRADVMAVFERRGAAFGRPRAR
jgi:hypothetical protein